ncbi:acyl carrier protein [Streptomyces jumonjinensis]|uniref:acyl carrier protein n=1 Tax=Streptomyces jumonjinensis TaxID=1945 RepID=UPI0037982AA5
MTPLQEKITELLVTRLGIDAKGIRPETTYTEMRMDSLALMEFTMIIQKELDVLLGDDELQGDSTVVGTARLIEAKGARA